MKSEYNKQLSKEGYICLRNFFSPEEVSYLRELCLNDSSKRIGSTLIGDIITKPEFRTHVFTPKLIQFLKTLLGEELAYVCDGSARGGDAPISKSARKFHSDSRDDDFDFKRLYPIYRLGIYLQNMDLHSNGLKIRPRSHNKLCIDHGNLKDLAYRVYSYIKMHWKIPWITLSFGKNLEATAGDLLLWNMRLHHTGYAVRLKWFPKISLHPILENLIPKSWSLENSVSRCVIFFAFAKPSEYARKYAEYIKVHPHTQDFLKASNFKDPELQEFLSKNGLTLLIDSHNESTGRN